MSPSFGLLTGRSNVRALLSDALCGINDLKCPVQRLAASLISGIINGYNKI